MKALLTEAANRAGVTPSSMQVTLWLFEQRLARSHGLNAPSQNYSQAAEYVANQPRYAERGNQNAARSAAEGAAATLYQRGVGIAGVRAHGEIASQTNQEAADQGAVQVPNGDAALLTKQDLLDASTDNDAMQALLSRDGWQAFLGPFAFTIFETIDRGRLSSWLDEGYLTTMTSLGAIHAAAFWIALHFLLALHHRITRTAPK